MLHSMLHLVRRLLLWHQQRRRPPTASVAYLLCVAHMECQLTTQPVLQCSNIISQWSL
eukprot:SAG31_NODE_1105_length_9882_cov_5.270571_9_plen_58_part_00